MITPKIGLAAGAAIAIIAAGLAIDRSAYSRGKQACEAAVIIAANKELERQRKAVEDARSKLASDIERISTYDATGEKATDAARAVHCSAISDVVFALREYEANLPITPK